MSATHLNCYSFSKVINHDMFFTNILKKLDLNYFKRQFFTKFKEV